MVKTRYIYRLIILAVVTVLALSGCEMTSSPRFDGDVYSVAGLLVAGEPVGLEYPVYVTRSESLEGFDPLNLFVLDAQITVRDSTAGISFDLFPTLHEFKIKYIDPAANIIQPGHLYRIEVRVPGYDKLIWAETQVPLQAQLVTDLYGTNQPGTGWSTDPDTQNTVKYSEIDTQYPIALGTGDVGGDRNFVAEIYCREEFSTDLEFTIQVFGITNPDPSLEAVYNSNGDSPRRITLAGRFNSRPQDDLAGNYLLLRNYSQGIAFYGRYRVKAFIVDDNYYRYTFMPDGYLSGGMHNALGYFGSAAGGYLYSRVVK